MEHQLLPSKVGHLRGGLAVNRWQGERGKEIADLPTLGVATHEGEGNQA